MDPKDDSKIRPTTFGTPMKNNDIFFKKLCGIKTSRVKKSQMKYLEKMNGKYELEDFKNLITYFIWHGKSLLYCKSVLITINNHLKNTVPNYKKPFRYYHIFQAYRSANKLSNTPHALYSGSTKIDSSLYAGLKVNMGHVKHLPTVVIKTIHDTCCFNLYTKCTHFFKYLQRDFDPNTKEFDTDNIEIFIFLLILMYTGMRCGEVLQLTHRHVNEIVKTKKTQLITKVGPRFVSFGEMAIKLLLSYTNYKKVNGEIFTDDSKCFVTHYNKLRKLFVKFHMFYFNSVKPKGALFHIFRSHFTYVASQSKSNPLITQQLLNHNSISTTNIYKRNQVLNDVNLRNNVLNYVEDHLQQSI